MSSSSFLEELQPPGVQLIEQQHLSWITEQPRRYLLLELRQLADGSLTNSIAFVSVCRLSLWSQRWERISVDVPVVRDRSNKETNVYVYDLNWAQKWLEIIRPKDVGSRLDVLFVRLELMNSTDTAVVEVVHLPIRLANGVPIDTAVDGSHSLKHGLNTSALKPIILAKANERITIDVTFQQLRTSSHSLAMQRRMAVTATKLAFQGRTLTIPGAPTGWDLISTPNPGPLEFATIRACGSDLNMSTAVTPRTYATILGVNFHTRKMLASGSNWVKVYASARTTDHSQQGRTSLLGEFRIDPYYESWADMSELDIPVELNVRHCGLQIVMHFVQQEGNVDMRHPSQSDGTPTKSLAQAVLLLSVEHLLLLGKLPNGPVMDSLPSGVYEVPVTCCSARKEQRPDTIGMLHLRLSSFAADLRCSWWAPEGLARLVYVPPDKTTFDAFLHAVQRCDAQLVDAIFGAATPVDILQSLDALLQHLKPLNQISTTSEKFQSGCTTLAVVLSYLSDDAMAHPSLSKLVTAALLSALKHETIMNIIVCLSNLLIPEKSSDAGPLQWPRVRALCWLVSEVLTIVDDDVDGDDVTAWIVHILAELSARLRSACDESTLEASADGIAASVCLSILLRGVFQLLPAGLVVQHLLLCFPPQAGAGEKVAELYCAQVALLAQLMRGIQAKQIPALCHEEVIVDDTNVNSTLALQLSCVTNGMLIASIQLSTGDCHDGLAADKLVCATEWLVDEHLHYFSKFTEATQDACSYPQASVHLSSTDHTSEDTPMAVAAKSASLPPPPSILPRRRQHAFSQDAPAATISNIPQPFQQSPQHHWSRFMAAAELYVCGEYVPMLSCCVQHLRAGGDKLRTACHRLLGAFKNSMSAELRRLSRASDTQELIALHGQLNYVVQAGYLESSPQKSNTIALLFQCMCEMLTCLAIERHLNGVKGGDLDARDCSLLLLGSEVIAALQHIDMVAQPTASAMIETLPATLIVGTCKILLSFVQTVCATDRDEVSTILSCLALLSSQLKEHAPHFHATATEVLLLEFDAVTVTHWVLAAVHAADTSLRQRVSTPVSAELLLALKIPLLYVFDIISSTISGQESNGGAVSNSTLGVYLQTMIHSLTIQVVDEQNATNGSVPVDNLPLKVPNDRKAADETSTITPHPARLARPIQTVTPTVFKQYIALYQSLLYDDRTPATNRPARLLDLSCDGHTILIPCKWSKSMNICAPGSSRSEEQLFHMYTHIRRAFMMTERDVANLAQYLSCQADESPHAGAALCRAALLEYRISTLQDRFSMAPAAPPSPPHSGILAGHSSEDTLTQLEQSVAAWQEVLAKLPHPPFHGVSFRTWQLKLQVASIQKQDDQLSLTDRVQQFRYYHEALRRLLVSMMTGGKWESIRRLLAMVAPWYQSESATGSHISNLRQELERFNASVSDHLGRHGACRCLPMYFAVYLSRWPWERDTTPVVHFPTENEDNGGLWLLIKSDPAPTLSQSDPSILPSQSGYYAVLQRLREWFPDYRVMPPGLVANHGRDLKRPFMQVYLALPHADILTHGRARICHTVDANVCSRQNINSSGSLGGSNVGINGHDDGDLSSPTQLDVNTALSSQDNSQLEHNEYGASVAASWHEIDLASTFTVHIEHQRIDGAERPVEADDISVSRQTKDEFGVVTIELTAQTGRSCHKFEAWGSPLALAEASKPVVVSSLDAAFAVHKYGAYCLERLSNAIDTIANEKHTDTTDNGICNLQAIRDSMIATLEVDLHVPSLSPLGIHNTPFLAAEYEDRLDALWREQRKAMKQALIRTNVSPAKETPVASDMEAVKARLEGDLRKRIALLRAMYLRHKRALARALSTLRAPKLLQPIAPTSLSTIRATTARKSDNKQDEHNYEICLWLESLYATILDDGQEVSP